MAAVSAPAGLILAAGKGTRMKSDLPKCLHEVCGVPMAQMVIRSLRDAGVERIVVVVGHGGEEVRERLGDSVEYAVQEEQLGTGHAVMSAQDALKDHKGPLIVACGDTPLLRAETTKELLDLQAEKSAGATLSYCRLEDPTGYGRIMLGTSGQVLRIVEHKDCTPDELSTKEINPALYAFDTETLFRLLPTLKNTNEGGEYYLTDIIGTIREEGGSVIGQHAEDFAEFLGINNRWQLAEASEILRSRILMSHAMNGVTITDPKSTYIEGDVEIETDAIIHPMSVIEGKTKIGARAQIGPSTWIKDSVIGEGCRVFMSHVDQAEMGRESRCGPFANLRPKTRLNGKVKIGNFVEVKNAEIGDQTSVSHLTYIGDAMVGERTNIGAGTITCNYDGFAKHLTKIGSDAFIGSNSTLVAPVEVGDGAMTAAGSTVTKKVPGDSLAVGRGRQENKEGWVKSWRAKKSRESDH